MKEIIEKAVAGGWKPRDTTRDYKISDFGILYNSTHICKHCSTMVRTGIYDMLLDSAKEIVCDPLFWQALAKECMWGIEPSGSIWQGEQQYIIYGEKFMRINLTEGWEAGISFLQEVTK